MGTCGHHKKKDCWLHNPVLLVIGLLLMATMALFSAFTEDRQAFAEGSMPAAVCGCDQKLAGSCFMAVYSASDANMTDLPSDPNLPTQ